MQTNRRCLASYRKQNTKTWAAIPTRNSKTVFQTTHKYIASLYYFNKTIMPTLSDSISHQYNLRNNTDKQYNYIIDNKQQLSFSKNCITTWNSLPKDLKEMPYTRTSYQHFKFMSKRHLIHRQS